MKKKVIRSFYPKKDSLQSKWVVYDAKDKILGRAASDIASLLLGKFTATYTPGSSSKQHVIVINAESVKVTGKKFTDKVYYKHTGFKGGLKEATFKELKAKHPTDPLRKAVNGMLPHNSYGRSLQRNVRFIVGEEHHMEAQQPTEFVKG
tara:strand:- start:3054 stop:3500 length:447 start_codon:yes stop_codon:yes gene_type:complete